MANAIKSTLSQDVVLNYTVLPEIYGSLEDEFEYIPEQIEIDEAWLELKNRKSGKIRRINITDTLSDDQIMKFEDEVTMYRAMIKRNFLNKKRKDTYELES
jgi:hypothetical protein